MDWNSKDKLALRVVEYYAQQENGKQHIIHSQAVANYTRLIASGEGLDQKNVDLQEMAAWLHDIGCPAALRIHKSTAPEYQQKEGRILASLWLKYTDYLTISEKDWLIKVVASHHEYQSAQNLKFIPLFEADLIVNLLEGTIPAEQAPQLYETLIVTATGRKLFALLFPIEIKEEEKE